MNYVERPLVFDCEGETLVGVLSAPDTPASVAVLVIVGGPQYRVGSHRQFVLFARRLAAAGFAVLRFDYRGMGDAGGVARTFEECAADIAAAMEALCLQCPEVRKIVLWGLCDAASASLIYMQQRRDPRIAGLVLLNPWVRSVATLSKTHLKHYYGKRLLDRQFWAKLLSGGVRPGTALRALADNIRNATVRSKPGTVSGPATFQDQMLEGWRAFSGPVLLILSGEDLTAREFLEYAGSHAAWGDLLQRREIERCDIADADHTFSSAPSKDAVETQTLQWLSATFPASSRRPGS